MEEKLIFLGVKFEKVDDNFRHPSQIYEAILKLNIIFVAKLFLKIPLQNPWPYISYLFNFLFNF